MTPTRSRIPRSGARQSNRATESIVFGGIFVTRNAVYSIGGLPVEREIDIEADSLTCACGRRIIPVWTATDIGPCIEDGIHAALWEIDQ